MIRKNLTSDELASVLLLEPDLEPYPEPFRMNPNLILDIEFDEYIQFIEFFIGQEDLLSLPSKELKQLSRDYRLGKVESGKKLWQAFLKDMSLAVFKEITYAEAFGKGCVGIQHSRYANEFYLTDKSLKSYYLKVKDFTLPKMCERLYLKGYKIPNRVSAHNMRSFIYSVSLYYLSDIDLIWSYQIKN